jgi:hypothetical protein
MWSFLLAAYGIFGFWLAGRPTTRAIGWLWNMWAQVWWVVYALATHQYGFILASVFYGAVFWRNWRAALRQEA